MTTTTQEVNNGAIVTANFKEKSLEKELDHLNTLLASLHNTDRKMCLLNEMQIQEKKCICLLKLKRWEQILEDGYRTIGKRGPSVVIFKCIIAANFRLGKYDEVHEVLEHWKRLSPKCVMMMEAKQKLERCLSAIRSGMSSVDVLQNLEQSLGLYSEWIYRKSMTNNNGNFKYRPPPRFATTFYMCSRGGQDSCIFGDKCIAAHSQDELTEWKQRLEKKMDATANLTKPNSSLQYLIDITKRINETTNIRTLLADEIQGVRFKCTNDMKRVTFERGDPHTWSMLVVTKSPLRTVSLLHDVHRTNFWISAASFYSVASRTDLDLFELHDHNKVSQLQVCNTFVPHNIFGKLGGWPDWFYYKLEVTFRAAMYGSYRQTIMFDMKYDPKLVKHIQVELQARSSIPFNLEDVDQELKIIQNPQKNSNLGNYEVVDADAGLHVNSVPPNVTPDLPNNNSHLAVSDEIRKDNYISAMERFLKMEEKARQEELTKYNISGSLEITSNYTIERNYESLLKCSWQGQLYAKLNLQKEISEDTKLGRLILRDCQNVLLLELKNVVAKPRGYICKIADKMKSSIIIAIGQQAVKELSLVAGTNRHFVVQFLLDDRNFKEMHTVLEAITDTQLNILFPDFSQPIDFSHMVKNQSGLFYEGDFTLNAKQMEAYNAVTNEHLRSMPPLLVIGPFGTGKTYSLAQCLKKLISNNSSLSVKPRVLICTHSNSAADLYITNYLHQWFEEGIRSARPLRIYYADRLVQTVPHVVKKYCLLTGDGMNFRYPTKEEVLDHQVIIVTLSTSNELLELGLQQNTFTHILLDEAAQALETEAIQPLMLAGPLTRVVLAGDHMQLSPELFSTFSQGRAISLLERLHEMYPKEHPCRIVLTDNYRSHEAILRFASEAFYGGQLRCASVQPNPSTYPLTFFSVRGEDILPENGSSYYNMAEVFEVTERILELVNSWPGQWGHSKDDNAIAVLTPYADQVTRIRAQLRSRGLGYVSVERVLNVQGKQFRAVFVSTVRTSKPWATGDIDLVGSFFSNPKLLNTALTRAQSLFAVVGDPISLCSMGTCRNIWDELIAVAAANDSFFGMNHTDLKKQLLGLEMKATCGYNPLATNPEHAEHNVGFKFNSSAPSPLPYQPLYNRQPQSYTPQQQHQQQLSSPSPPIQKPQLTSDFRSSSPLPTFHHDDLFQSIGSVPLDADLKSAFEDSAEERKANEFVDKLLFPNVTPINIRDIWSNSSGSGNSTSDLSSNNNIWAPPKEFSYSPKPLLSQSVIGRSTGSSNSLVANVPEASSFQTLQQRKNHPQGSTSLSRESKYVHDEGVLLNEAGTLNNLPLNELNFNSQPHMHKQGSNHFVPPRLQSQFMQSLQSSNLQLHLNGNYGRQEITANFMTSVNVRANSDFLLKNNPGSNSVRKTSQLQLANGATNANRPLPYHHHQPLFQQQQQSYSDYHNNHNHHSAALSGQVTRVSAPGAPSPGTSVSSSEASDYIIANEFPSLQETTKGKQRRQQHQTQQPEVHSQPAPPQHEQSQAQHSSNTSTNNDWVQVKKKKTNFKRQKEVAPVPSGEEKVEILMNMGWDKKLCIKALQYSQKNLDQAVEWLLSKSGDN